MRYVRSVCKKHAASVNRNVKPTALPKKEEESEDEYSSNSSNGSNIHFEIKSTQCVLEEVEDEVAGLKSTLSTPPQEQKLNLFKRGDDNFKKIVKLGTQVRSLTSLVKELQQKVHTYKNENIALTEQVNNYEEREFERILAEGDNALATACSQTTTYNTSNVRSRTIPTTPHRSSTNSNSNVQGSNSSCSSSSLYSTTPRNQYRNVQTRDNSNVQRNTYGNSATNQVIQWRVAPYNPYAEQDKKFKTYKV